MKPSEMNSITAKSRLLVFSAIVLLAILGCQSKAIPTAPQLKDVVSISAYYEGPENSNGWFDVPKKDWQTILEALSPAMPDPRPATWVSYGELKITLKNGNNFSVHLFDLHGKQPGAFAMGETWESRTYFRGGNFAKIKQTLEAAVKEAK